MTHYDSAAYLAEAITALLRAQDFDRFNLLLADDATPNDDWRDAIAPFRSDARLAVLRSERNVGTYRLLNRCLAMADTGYLCIHDADDTSTPDRLSRQVRFLDRHPRVAMLGSAFRLMDEHGTPGRIVRMPYNVNLHDRLGRRFNILHPTIMFRRRILDVLGGYDGTRRYAADQDLFMRATLRFSVRNLRRPLFNYRQHSVQMTRSPSIGMGSDERQRYAADIRARRSRLRHAGTPVSAFAAPANDVEFALTPA